MRAQPDNSFERRFLNRLEELNRVTEEAVRFVEQCGVGERAVYVANLAIEELATNILKYGYDDTAAHEILLRIEILEGELLVVLEDDGHAFNPIAAPEPDVVQPAEERPPGGLGIYLIRNLAERLEYERRDGRNRLTVRIRC
jgi:anti-sigma regulatory factor (Ser/Thr protein kinase)